MFLVCCSQFRIAFEARDRKRYQCVDELFGRDAARFPQLRVHADRGEARDGVYFIDEHIAVLLKKEIDTAHTFAAERLEGFYGERLDLLFDLLRDLRGDGETGAVVIDIFRLVGIEFMVWKWVGTEQEDLDIA